ncbi:MAG TPA: TonB-dependent receptor [Chitinophaga sp.]|uniref:TonB-dependent receptor n=1 Tax=Chitinophaga sp. TaxID=1869181 RepID=UPI002DBAB438|nr:TonB-dependent receptor [Chitinophaga sp.]HEU4551776.1 TonB-dependent receptor [Chitinophaga sp.]
MKLTLLLIIFLILKFIPGVQAQTHHGKISGVVLDAGGHTIPGATISLTNNSDSASKKTRITGNNGTFHFVNLKSGVYSLQISYVGFKPYSNAHLLINDSIARIQLPPIILTSFGQALREVVVTSNKPLVEHKIDRTMVNLDAMLSAAGANVLDALSQSPGVIVDGNGNISLNGKNNVLVLIDDRPTYMSAQDLAAYLRSLPAGTADKLELISNPPARYDASGNAIINIILKKNKAAGFNGAINFGYNQGKYARSNNALNINYRTRRFNLFGNGSYSHDKNYSSETYSRYFYDTSGFQSAAALQESRYTYQSNSFNGRIGMDYFISDKATLGVIISGTTRPKNDLRDYAGDQYGEGMRLDSVTRGFTSGNYSWRNRGVNLNLQQKLDSTGAAVTANLDYLNYYSGSSQTSPITSYNSNGLLKSSLLRVFSFPSRINIYAGKIDYVRPLRGEAQFDAGIKSSSTSTDARSYWLDGVNRRLVPDYSKTNHFRYTENISSAYVNFRKEWKRWAVQGGLRVEHTVAKGHQFSNPIVADSSFTKRYTSLFPSLYISYKLDSSGANTLVLNYSKRIRRPNYQQINPFLFFIDQYTYTSGNPNVTAAFAQYIELRYTYKQYFGITLTYGGGNREINPLTYVSENIFITRPYNFIDAIMYGITPYISVQPFQWWNMNFNVVLLYLVNKGSAEGVVIRQHANVHEIETSNHFQLSKTWSVELNGFFPGKQSYGQTKAGSIYNISVGVQKNIIHGNGTIRCNVNDIFHSLSMARQTVGISQVSAFSHKETDSRWIGMSFIYHFGKSANARKRNDNGSAEEEKSRVY